MSLAEAKAVDSESVKQCYSSGKELACRCPGPCAFQLGLVGGTLPVTAVQGNGECRDGWEM